MDKKSGLEEAFLLSQLLEGKNVTILAPLYNAEKENQKIKDAKDTREAKDVREPIEAGQEINSFEEIKLDSRHITDQYGQTKALLQYCNNLMGGVFIDVGCNDGYELSNTYYLEKMLDWKGVLFEPNKDYFEQACHNRWNTVYNAAIWKEKCEENFLHIKGYSELISGLINGYTIPYYERVQREIKAYEQEAQIYPIPCIGLNNIVEITGIKKADYLSLDTQSSEYQVLKSYDETVLPIKVIGLDTQGCLEEEIFDILKGKGYRKLWKHEGANEYLFCNDEIKWIGI